MPVCYNYYLPSNHNEILFKYEDGTLFNGILRIIPYSHRYATYFPEKDFTIESGYLIGVSDESYSGGYYGGDLNLSFMANDGGVSYATVVKADDVTYPTYDNPFIIPVVYHSVDLTVNIAPQSPHVLTLFVDDVNVSTGTQQLTYTGDARVIDVRMFGVKLYQKAVVSPGAFVLNLSMTAKMKQLDLSGFEIVEGGITNNSGRTIPEVAVKSI